jgi:hypothetical protein
MVHRQPVPTSWSNGVQCRNWHLANELKVLACCAQREKPAPYSLLNKHIGPTVAGDILFRRSCHPDAHFKSADTAVTVETSAECKHSVLWQNQGLPCFNWLDFAALSVNVSRERGLACCSGVFLLCHSGCFRTLTVTALAAPLYLMTRCST